MTTMNEGISGRRMQTCRRLSRGAIAGLLALGAVAAASAEERPTTPPSGKISIHQVQVAFLASGAVGGGKLTYKGRTYNFKLGGLGVGGIGASRLNASGDVYGLDNISDFPGPYAAIRSGWALGDMGKGRMWLRNAKGVMLSLAGKREGLQTALGAEGVVIELE